MTIRRSAHARVTVTLEIAVRSAWGEKCDLAQVYRQGTREAEGHIERFVIEASKNGALVRLVGKPKVEAIITERDER